MVSFARTPGAGTVSTVILVILSESSLTIADAGVTGTLTVAMLLSPRDVWMTYVNAVVPTKVGLGLKSRTKPPLTLPRLVSAAGGNVTNSTVEVTPGGMVSFARTPGAVKTVPCIIV